MTDEDVLPRWLRTYLLQQPHPSLDPARVSRVKLRICRTCNAASHKAFEDPASPVIKRMIAGASFTMSSDQARSVGLWMLKTEAFYGLMRHWRDDMHPSVHPAFRESYDRAETGEPRRAELHRLIYERVAPANSTVSAVLVGRDWSWRRRPILNRADGRFQTHGVANVYPLVFETITGDGAADDHRRARSSDPRFVVFWPVIDSASVRWPPKANHSA